MTKATLTKILGTALATIAAGGAPFIPVPYGAAAAAFAALLIGWLHLPQPGAVKVAP